MREAEGRRGVSSHCSDVQCGGDACCSRHAEVLRGSREEAGKKSGQLFESESV